MAPGNDGLLRRQWQRSDQLAGLVIAWGGVPVHPAASQTSRGTVYMLALLKLAERSCQMPTYESPKVSHVRKALDKSVEILDLRTYMW